MSNDEDIARIQGAHELGLAFVRSIILLNGGAFAILLSYMAASDVDSLVKFSENGIKVAIYNFLAGIVFVLAALGISYIYTALNFASPFRNWLDDKLIPLNAVMCLLAIVSFVFGVVYLVQTAEVR